MFDAIADETLLALVAVVVVVVVVKSALQLSVEQQDIVREPYVGSVILPAVHVAEHAFAM